MRTLFLYLISLIFLGIYNESKAFEDKSAKSFMGLYEAKQGLLAHDRGWFGKNREGFGPDYNFELMFNSPKILKKIGSPKPIMGLTQTSTGGSSLYYGGITWDANISKNWFVTGTTGIAYDFDPRGKRRVRTCQQKTGDGDNTLFFQFDRQGRQRLSYTKATHSSKERNDGGSLGNSRSSS